MQSVPLSIPIADPSRAPLTSSSLSMLPFLIQLGLFAWFIERWVVPFSNGVPLAAVVWATIQYGRIKRRTTVEDLNKRWKHLILNKKPTTLIKPCEWLNKLLLEIWPNYMEPKLSKRFQSTVEYHSCVHHLVTKS